MHADQHAYFCCLISAFSVRLRGRRTVDINTGDLQGWYGIQLLPHLKMFSQGNAYMILIIRKLVLRHVSHTLKQVSHHRNVNSGFIEPRQHSGLSVGLLI